MSDDTNQTNTLSKKTGIKNTLMLYIRMFVLMIIGFITTRVVLRSLGEVDYGAMEYKIMNGETVISDWSTVAPSTTNVGDYKVLSILGALRGGIPDVLITDVTTATKVLMKNEELNQEAQ